MAAPPTEEQLWCGSEETEVRHLSVHGGGYPSVCTDQPSALGGPAVQNTEPRDDQSFVSTATESGQFFSQVDSDDECDPQVIQEDSNDECDPQVIEEDSDDKEGSSDEEDRDGYDAQMIYENSVDEEVIGKDSKRICPGKNYSKEEVDKIFVAWIQSYNRDHNDCLKLRKEILARGDKNERLPSYPMKVLPVVTDLCLQSVICYHREYMTDDTSMTASIFGYRKPRLMLQLFSLRLTSYVSYPISVYGILAVRDYLDPRRNLVFKCSRDDAITVEQDFFTLPLCSPCRGMYVPDEYALLEVDLWVKEEDGLPDEQLLFAYVEIYVQSWFDKMRT